MRHFHGDYRGNILINLLVDSQETRDDKQYVPCFHLRTCADQVCSRYEAYDRVEGSAVLASKNAHADDDGKIDRSEAKALKEEKNHQLNMRHRGVMQYQAVR